MSEAVSEGKIFVGGLSQQTTTESLHKYFSTYGSIVDSVVMFDALTKRSRGFGFVTFTDSNVINNVLSLKHKIDNKLVECKRACPKELISTPASVSTSKISNPIVKNKKSNNVYSNSYMRSSSANNNLSHSMHPNYYYNYNNSSAIYSNNSSYSSMYVHGNSSNLVHANYMYNFNRTEKIFIGGLPDLTTAELKEYFSAFGVVVDAVVINSKTSGRPRGFGFVTFRDAESVEATLRKGNHVIKRKPVEVKKAMPKEDLSGPPSKYAGEASSVEPDNIGGVGFGFMGKKESNMQNMSEGKGMMYSSNPYVSSSKQYNNYSNNYKLDYRGYENHGAGRGWEVLFGGAGLYGGMYEGNNCMYENSRGGTEFNDDYKIRNFANADAARCDNDYLTNKQYYSNDRYLSGDAIPQYTPSSSNYGVGRGLGGGMYFPPNEPGGALNKCVDSGFYNGVGGIGGSKRVSGYNSERGGAMSGVAGPPYNAYSNNAEAEMSGGMNRGGRVGGSEGAKMFNGNVMVDTRNDFYPNRSSRHSLHNSSTASFSSSNHMVGSNASSSYRPHRNSIQNKNLNNSRAHPY